MKTSTQMMSFFIGMIATMCFSFASVAQNLVTNPGFESWTEGKPDGWFGTKTNLTATGVVQSTNSHDGSSSCQLINTESSHKRFTSQSLIVTAGQEYTVTFWLRGGGDVRSGFWDGQGSDGANFVYNDYITATGTWTQQTQKVTAPVTAANAELIFSVRNTTGDNILIDDVEMTAGGAIPLKAEFKADKTTSEAGSTIQFTDMSTGSPIQWEWTVSGAEDFTSTDQNPSFTFSKTGSYDVKLVVSNAETSDELTKADYITIGDFILTQDFNSGNFGDWTAVSVKGEQAWIISETGGPDGSSCAQMNGYSGGNNENEDWLVSPKISACDLLVSFDNAMNFTGDALKLMYTTNYAGDVTSTTWNEYTFTASTGSYAWVNSGNLNIYLCETDATDIRIAFKYTSTTSDGALWRVDNILIQHSNAISIPTVEKSEYNVYPNPSTGIFNITADGNATVKVFNITGSLVKELNTVKIDKIDLSMYTKGIYFLQIIQENGIITTQKVILK